MKKSYFIIGLGRFGLSLIDELSNYSDEVIGIDTNEEAVEEASKIIDKAYIADSTSENAMRNVGIQNADHVVIAFGNNFEGTIMTYATLRDLGIENITVRCDIESHIPILAKLGVTDIISPTKIAGKRLASRIISPNLVDYFQLTGDYCVVDVTIPDSFKPTTVENYNPRNKFDVNLLLIKRKKITLTPRANEEILPGDEIFVFGTRKNISDLMDSLK